MCGLKRRYLIAKVQFVNELIFENIVAKSKIFLHLLIKTTLHLLGLSLA